MPDVKITSEIQNSIKGVGEISLDKINVALETVNENLKKANLELPNISIANVTGVLQNLDSNLTQSLNDDLLKTINDVTGSISGVKDAFNNVIGGFSDELSGLAGKIGGLNQVTSQLDSLTSQFSQIDNLLNVSPEIKLPGLDELNQLVGSLEGFVQQAQGLFDEVANFGSEIENLVNDGAAESLKNLVDKTIANPDFYLDDNNTVTVETQNIAQGLIDSGELKDKTIFKIESSKDYFVVENGEQALLWDYNVRRVRNGQTPFKPNGAIVKRIVAGVPIFKSSK
jgi:ABC-type transporter Mla subunit MlaD